MTESAPVDDLVVLVADKDMEQTIAGLLSRPEALQIAPVTKAVYVHPDRDSGCRASCHEFLRSMQRKFRFALVMFDRHGSGWHLRPREQIESEVEGTLGVSGWRQRSAVITLDPELETWVWSDSPEVDQVVGWSGRNPGLREWIGAQGFAINGSGKPTRPKQALRTALREVGKPPSAAIFRSLAERVSVHRCSDSALRKLLSVLREWFPERDPEY